MLAFLKCFHFKLENILVFFGNSDAEDFFLLQLKEIRYNTDIGRYGRRIPVCIPGRLAIPVCSPSN